jgi:hypothetical protein
MPPGLQNLGTELYVGVSTPRLRAFTEGTGNLLATRREASLFDAVGDLDTQLTNQGTLHARHLETGTAARLKRHALQSGVPLLAAFRQHDSGEVGGKIDK